ncbi:CD36 family protein [Lebetimonas sp. JS032]|uniref:CD36 family protein n=2 Tax=Lebetimonas TaxID=267989 RepID=UPI0004BC8745|nr:CD36 family protein [Lebetimonas sp. JS032]
MLGKSIKRELLPLKAGLTYYELVQLWIFDNTNYFKEAKDEFLKTDKKINFQEANEVKPYKRKTSPSSFTRQ